MRYLIDGYNLLFRTLVGKSDEELKVQREKVISELAKRIRVAKIDAILVFDSHFRPGPEERKILRELDVHFTQEGQIADEYLLDLLAKEPHPGQVAIVSCDQNLAWRARELGGKSHSVDEFLATLKRIFLKKSQVKPQEIKNEPIKKSRPKKTLEERYLELFSREEEAPRDPSNPKEKLKLKKKAESDFERWESAFTREITESDE